MRFLSLWQPWASLIALGVKGFETRSWATRYRGPLAIHAGTRPAREKEVIAIYDSLRKRSSDASLVQRLDLAIDQCLSKVPLGCIVAITNLTECLYMVEKPGDPPVNSSGQCLVDQDTILIPSMSPLELAVGDWSHGRFAWRLKEVSDLTEPVPLIGRQGLQVLPDCVVEQVLSKVTREETHE